MLHPLPDSAAIIGDHDACLAANGRGAPWPALPASAASAALLSALWEAIRDNHANNARLWAEEDLARRRDVPDAAIAANKRAIDGFNQARNDATERVDEQLLTMLGLVDAASARTDSPRSTVSPGARLNSETAGSMIDRLSILALKVQAMREQAARRDVDEAHRQASEGRLQRLTQQRADLAGCLDALLQEAAAGRAYFKVYRQFKMYNDPRFNPALVREAAARAGAGGSASAGAGGGSAPAEAGGGSASAGAGGASAGQA